MRESFTKLEDDYCLFKQETTNSLGQPHQHGSASAAEDQPSKANDSTIGTTALPGDTTGAEKMLEPLRRVQHNHMPDRQPERGKSSFSTSCSVV